MAEIKSEMAGNVWKIVAAVGDTVEEGDTLVILESMKMEIPIESEYDGTVGDICVEEGEAIDEGTVIAIIEED